MGMRLSPKSVKWTVEKIRGHMQGWEIVCHSDQPIEHLIKHHAHG
jgi:hypothetical protein